MAVAKSTDGGKTYPAATYFAFQSGNNHFNDKPIIAADTNLSSPFRDHVYAAWDAASGGSIGGGIHVAASANVERTEGTKRGKPFRRKWCMLRT
jgi:hypothetical protein